ncbi:response regulator [Pseudomonas koreensis]|uniref:response regulator n=1 Tax=Pseudomonas koreensis TaxID=198620 RepID=UPI002FC59808
MQKKTIVIADDHPVVVLGVRALVQRVQCFEVIGEAASSTELVQVLNKRVPDILITDYSMPESSVYGDGLKLIKFLRKKFPPLQILILTMISNGLILSRLADLGVAGVVQKRHVHMEIHKALNDVIHGRDYECPKIAKRSVVASHLNVEERLASLSIRELEILRLFIAGMSLRDIAEDQSRSAKTISTQKVTAMRKLRVSSDQELITFCAEANLFQ